MLIASVAIPLPNVDTGWDYIIPADLANNAKVGQRVLIPVSSRRITGFIVSLRHADRAPTHIKTVEEVLDQEPLVTESILNLTEWAADYYLTSWGDMIKAALPAGLSIREEERFHISQKGREFVEDKARRDELITEDEGAMVDTLEMLKKEGALPAQDIQKRTSGALIHRMFGRGLIERKKTRTGSKNIEKKQLAVEATDKDPASVDDSFWNRSKKRRTALEALKRMDDPVLMTDVEEQLGVSRSVIEGLQEGGFARISAVRIRRNPFRNIDVDHGQPHPLTPAQEEVYSPVLESLTDGGFKTFLLHGVTGSGKTEIYLHLIQHCLEKGRQALVLIPELSLTPQFVRRYYAAFGERLAILHSALGQGERRDEWDRVRKGQADIVLGTRLSIFAPLQRPGLIIVDEEHDSSYKQDDYPGFNARDLAVIRAHQSSAVCLLGSATPSLESFFNAGQGKYRLLELKERVFQRPLPEITLIDLRSDEHTRAEDSPYAPSVQTALQTTLDREEQSIVMVGRKGFNPFVLCRNCGHSFECRTCTISMAWHDTISQLKCHYCGRTEKLKKICPQCGSTSIARLGTGSAQVEQQTRLLFPDARIARMDRDAINHPSMYARTLTALRKREIDILVGTQMLAKGHDYPDVTTVVALGIDGVLNLPDFRHAERLWQLITQISGRAGRAERPGRVFVQTYRPDHYSIRNAVDYNVNGFLDRELDYRKHLRYPPYGFLAMLLFEDFKRERAMASATAAAETLQGHLARRAYILGPALAPYARLKNRWRVQIFIKAADRSLLNKALRETRKEHKGSTALKIFIDPVSVM